MKLTLENVGKFHEQCQFEFNGITVVAGENGTGKSTIGKVLYSIFDTFYRIDLQIKEMKVRSVTRCFVDEVQEQAGYANQRTFIRVAREIVGDLQNHVDKEVLRTKIRELSPVLFSDERIEILLDEIQKKLQISDKEITKRLLRYRLDAEFGINIGHVNYSDSTSIWELALKEGLTRCQFIEAEGELEINIERNVDIRHNVIYLDDFSIQYALGDTAGGILLLNEYAHGASVRKMSRTEKKVLDRESKSAIDDILQDEKSKQIFEIMKTMDIGELEEEKGNIRYVSSNLKKPLKVENLSSGLKSLLTIKKLIKEHTLKEKSVLILDEPEIHLHPEWQKQFAHIIVLLHKCMDITVLISTHSTDFLSFIELYSRKYKLQDKCKYYLLDESEYASNVSDVTEQIDKIYEQLGMPFLKVSEEF